ncbi:mucin-3A-like isoform X2 [Drosophila navojoa]|uniref:mucin-3A-like isoform X1 n=1 Tax=Drosophila navojoa TaxID=7232 RepID=UPI0011BE38B3|nr:mucin-3A-like isoform X1 [Drosophila navojoa]XP_030246503.1 mucin-3A-like isoform X2 [Drosophila navojoa]
MPDTSPPATTLSGTAPNGSCTTLTEIEITAQSTNIQTVSLIPSTLLMSKTATPNGDNQHLNTGTDNASHTKHPAVTCSTPVTNASISDCESYLASEAAHPGLELTPCTTTKGTTLSTKKIVTSNGMDTISLGTPLAPVTLASLHGSFADRPPNVVLSSNYKTNDHQQLNIDGRTTAGAVESQKNVNVSLSTSPVANGFLCSHSTVSCTTTSAVGKSLLNVSPHSGNKVLPIPSNTVVGSVVVAGSAITKSSLSTGTSSVGATGSSLVFHGASPLMSHSSAGLPMLIQATPYRSPFPNYSTLYTPYNNITHGQYLPSAIPMGNSNTSSLSQRSDNRNCRETQPMTSLKMPVTSASALNQHSANNIAGLRSLTPLGYMISNNNTTQVLGTIPMTTTTSVPSLHSTQSHLLPAAFSTSTTGPPISTTVGTSQTQPSAPMLPQSGYQSHVPQVANSYPQFVHTTSTTQQSLLRCTTTSTTSTSNASVLTVQSLMTAMPSPSINTSVASSSVIQKILSPKIDNRDRDTSYRY